MNYSPKLKEVMAEIITVLKRHDIAGHVVLYEPGFSEYLWLIDPSWSVMRFEKEGLRFESRLVDYGGDKARQQREQEASINMIKHFGDVLINGGAMAKEIERQLKKQIDFEHTEGVHTPDYK